VDEQGHHREVDQEDLHDHALPQRISRRSWPASAAQAGDQSTAAWRGLREARPARDTDPRQAIITQATVMRKVIHAPCRQVPCIDYDVDGNQPNQTIVATVGSIALRPQTPPGPPPGG